MKRIILALLALLGLVAQSAPVQARLCRVGSEQIGAVVSPKTQGQALAAQAVPSAVASARPERPQRECGAQPTGRKRPVYIPSVQLGADRARE